MPNTLGGVLDPARDTAFTGTLSSVKGFRSTGTVSDSGIGYGTGAGGTVTQATSKSTGVTLNKLCGAITMNGAALSNGAEVGFTVTNSLVRANDVPVVAIKSGATADSYQVTVDAVADGSFRISVSNCSSGSLSEAIVLSYVIVRGVSS